MKVKLKSTLLLLPLLLSASVVEPFWPLFNPFNPFSSINPSPQDTIFSNDPLPGYSDYTAESSSTAIKPMARESGNEYLGEWKLLTQNAGVSAMHMTIMRHNKAIMFDTTVFGPSKIPLPAGKCRVDPHSKNGSLDCWAHAVEFDWETAKARPLKILTDPWCSSGSFDADGNLIQVGGFNDGGRAIRKLSPCNTCDWIENVTSITGTRWYSTQAVLADGRFIQVGGRRQFGFEYILPTGKALGVAYPLPFLKETTDPVENNLYPFVNLLPDKTLFIFANNRAIILDPNTNSVLRELPALPFGARNYPASGMSALLPLRLRAGRSATATRAEVIVCGGGDRKGFALAENGTFLPATKTCGRIVVNSPNPQWHMETMPLARTMGDMLVLPNGQLLLLNGAARGASGWYFARDPVSVPLLYTPFAIKNSRFKALASSPHSIPRMYHSSSAVLPDGSVLVAGSNPNHGYQFKKVMFKTELSVERFYPHYFGPEAKGKRVVIDERSVGGRMSYGKSWGLEFTIEGGVVERNGLMVTMYAPPFTTHGYSMNQRLLILHVEFFGSVGEGRYRVVVSAPAVGAIAPAGYYLVYVVNDMVPSKGIWVQIK